MSLIVILSISIVSGLFANNNPCSECHGSKGYYQYCEFDISSSSLNIPETLGNEVAFISIPISIIGSGANQYYRVNKLKVTLESKNNLITIDNPIQEWNNLYPGGGIFYTTPIRGILKGMDILFFTLTGTNTHGSSSFSDSYSHEINVDIEDASQQELAVKPSTYSIATHEKIQYLQLSIIRDIDQINIIPSKGLTVSPDSISSLKKDETETIEIVVDKEENIEGIITINWLENSNEKSIQINFMYTSPTEEEVNIYSIIGRIAGLISLFLLIISIILSGVSNKLRKKINQLIKTRLRVKLHCYLSGCLLILSIFHGIILILGPYSEFILMGEVVLGYLTAISMLVVSINGLFIKRISKLIGPNLWRKTHGYYSYLTLVLCIIHALLIGTEFAFFRGLF